MLAAPSPTALWRSSQGPTAIGDYAMLWAPGAQMMSDGREAFTHDGAINTEPSHDLAHLIVAASSGLPWKPAGLRDLICFAEYNAVMMEHLLDRTYRSAISQEFPSTEIVPGLLSHGTWFVTKHFVPFPVKPAEALRRFRSGLSIEPVARLSPLFYEMKHQERSNASHMQGTWAARFRATDRPQGWQGLAQETARQLSALLR